MKIIKNKFLNNIISKADVSKSSRQCFYGAAVLVAYFDIFVTKYNLFVID